MNYSYIIQIQRLYIKSKFAGRYLLAMLNPKSLPTQRFRFNEVMHQDQRLLEKIVNTACNLDEEPNINY